VSRRLLGQQLKGNIAIPLFFRPVTLKPFLITQMQNQSVAKRKISKEK
jgi:hypothetical protein